MSFSPALLFYRATVPVLAPFARLWLGARAHEGKEDRARLGERFGHYDQQRPRGRIIWFHAASVGESSVAAGLIEALAKRDASLNFLISTGTRTSADLIARRALPRTTHVYAPLDSGGAVRRFFTHWQPDAGVFVESELWPNLILAAERRGVPLALVNARMSPKSLARWQRWGAAGARLLKAFAFVGAADARTAEALTGVRGADVPALGNLKLAAPAPRVDPGAREALAREIGGRPVWTAASTHEGEDEIVLAAHEMLRTQFDDALLIIAPRHPDRGDAIARLAGGAPRRSQFAPIGGASVYVADTLGELGVFYDLAPVALVAGSLLGELKGHNPIEPAKLDAAIVTGPYVESFQDVFDVMFATGGARVARDAPQLAEAVATLWRDEAERTRQLAAARAAVAQGGEAFETTMTQILNLLPQGSVAERAIASA